MIGSFARRTGFCSGCCQWCLGVGCSYRMGSYRGKGNSCHSRPHCYLPHIRRPGTKPSVVMGRDKPLPQEGAKFPKTAGKRRAPHQKNPDPSSESSSEDPEWSSSGDDGVPKQCSDTSSVNTATSETSLTEWLARGKPGSRTDVR